MPIDRVRWREAVEAFQEGRYFEAHEYFEGLWRDAHGQEREFYQGWLLAAAALFHRDRGNTRGAQLCYERASVHWGTLPDRFHGLRVSQVLDAVGRILGQEWATPELSEVLSPGSTDASSNLHRKEL